jgi:hypothetical protein
MSIHYQSLPHALAVAVLAMSVTMSAAQAAEQRGKPLQPAQVNAKWQQECSSCHVAFAPGLLPAESWRKVMGGLDKHFGTDASLAAEESKGITDFLVSNASNRWSTSTAPMRITEAAWFKREHSEKEIPPAVWNNPLVKSPANCQACHTQADRGDFSERNIKVPK